jgi:putative PIG3 family NAD(P)H quinone oxidoreductase
MLIAGLSQSAGSGVLSPMQVSNPTPDPGEVLIRVAAAGVNRADILQRRGLYPSPPGVPEWPGLEVSGTVTALGPHAERFSVGDQVCALLAGGGYAELAVASESVVLPVPPGVSVVDAGGLMETACTVWSNLREARAVPGELLLIHGGAGGIGVMAIQVAKAYGMRVLATAGTDERARACLALGADAAVNYSSQDWVATAQEMGGADVILDVVGGGYLSQNLAALATGGRLVVIGLQQGARAELDLGTLMSKRARVIGTTLRARPAADKARIVADVEHAVWPWIPDQVQPLTHATFPLSQAQQAHQVLESGGVTGKVLLIP